MQKGFTLIELSIVLVIVGLLIGGILAAQSMIETAKILNLIRQSQQFDIAVTNFRQKYNQWPGDSSLFPSSTTGCLSNQNNGDIEEYSGCTGGEPIDFWYHLSLNGFTQNGVIFNDDNTMLVPGLNIPQTTLGNYQGQPIGVFVMNKFINYNLNKKWYYYGLPKINPLLINASFTARFRATYAYSVEQVLAIDQKIDDGKNSSDSSLSYYVPDNNYTGIVVGTGSNCTTDGTDYKITYTSNQACALWIRIQSSIGQDSQ